MTPQRPSRGDAAATEVTPRDPPRFDSVASEAAGDPAHDGRRLTTPSGDFYAIQPEPLDLSELCARVAAPAYGAVATFSGTVRDEFAGGRVLYLEYEAYAGMALDVMREIGDDLHRRFELGRIAMAHRVGRLDVGETSVVVAVSAPHRRAALDACDEAIERLKATLPVWKKEIFEGGSVWRENAPPAGEWGGEGKS